MLSRAPRRSGLLWRSTSPVTRAKTASPSLRAVGISSLWVFSSIGESLVSGGSHFESLQGEQHSVALRLEAGFIEHFFHADHTDAAGDVGVVRLFGELPRVDPITPVANRDHDLAAVKISTN